MTLVSRLLKIFVLLAVTGLMTGCKLAVMVPEGGNVESTSSGNCTEGFNCLIEITDSSYREDFTAVAKPGYVFIKWNVGSGFACADSTNLTCTVSVPGGAFGDAIVASFEYRGYIMPIFSFVGIDTDGDGMKDHLDSDDDEDGLEDGLDNCPLVGPNLSGNGCPGNLITDTVTVDGNVWAQPAHFTGLSWNDIHAVCPAPAGVCSGILKGFDLTGWTWASWNEAASLLSFYIDGDSSLDGDPFTPNTPTNGFTAADSLWAPAFFSDFTPIYTTTSENQTRGFTRTRTGVYPEPGIPSITQVVDGFFAGDRANIFFTNLDVADAGSGSYGCCGAWFYRTP